MAFIGQTASTKMAVPSVARAPIWQRWFTKPPKTREAFQRQRLQTAPEFLAC